MMRKIQLALFAFCLLSLGCEVKTSVRVENGPSFLFSGSGHLASFRLYAPQSGHRIATPNDAESIVWQIEPMNDRPAGALVSKLALSYGKVPAGYVQKVPSKGSAPTLSTGLVYYFFAVTTGAPGKGGFFYLDKTGPTMITVPGLCESGFVGKVNALKCGTNDPFPEPKDLEQFVRENRIQE